MRSGRGWQLLIKLAHTSPLSTVGRAHGRCRPEGACLVRRPGLSCDLTAKRTLANSGQLQELPSTISPKNAENILFIGGTGTGKSRLATCIGIRYHPRHQVTSSARTAAGGKPSANRSKRSALANSRYTPHQAMGLPPAFIVGQFCEQSRPVLGEEQDTRG